MTTSSPTNIDYTQEVRFAVVMYGGVSLAIYINGIAQELLSMVRSTPEPKNGKSVPTATVEPGARHERRPMETGAGSRTVSAVD